MEQLSVVSPRSMRFVSENFSENHPRGNRKIYLSRSSSSWRRPINESDVIQEVLKRGFEAIDLTGMDMGNQLEIFKAAGTIIAPQGAAIFNAAFCGKGTKMLILTQGNLYNTAAVNNTLCDLGHDLAFLPAEPSEGAQHDDYTVPIVELRKAVHELIT